MYYPTHLIDVLKHFQKDKKHRCSVNRHISTYVKSAHAYLLHNTLEQSIRFKSHTKTLHRIPHSVA